MNQAELEFFKQHDIEVIKPIGEGGFGSVYYVFSNSYKTYFALKKIPQKNFKQAEVDSLMALDDPRIVRLYKYYKFEDNFYLLMEYCPGDLPKLLSDKQKMSNQAFIQRLIGDVVKAVKACHDIQIAHGDIKPANFLVDSYGRIKICDFGMSSKCTQAKLSTTNFKGTLYFMAPELFEIQPYNPLLADIWALGVTLFYIVTCSYPFNGLDQNAIKDRIIKGIFNQDLIKDSLLRDLISNCLETDVNYRAQIDEIVSHPYFAKNFSERIERIPIKKTDIIIKPLSSTSLNIRKHRSIPLFVNLNASRVHLVRPESPQ